MPQQRAAVPLAANIKRQGLRAPVKHSGAAPLQERRRARRAATCGRRQRHRLLQRLLLRPVRQRCRQ